jgi:hypothetical protein
MAERMVRARLHAGWESGQVMTSLPEDLDPAHSLGGTAYMVALVIVIKVSLKFGQCRFIRGGPFRLVDFWIAQFKARE